MQTYTPVCKHVYDARISRNARSHANARIAPRSSLFLPPNGHGTKRDETRLANVPKTHGVYYFSPNNQLLLFSAQLNPSRSLQRRGECKHDILTKEFLVFDSKVGNSVLEGGNFYAALIRAILIIRINVHRTWRERRSFDQANEGNGNTRCRGQLSILFVCAACPLPSWSNR